MPASVHRVTDGRGAAFQGTVSGVKSPTGPMVSGSSRKVRGGVVSHFCDKRRANFHHKGRSPREEEIERCNLLRMVDKRRLQFALGVSHRSNAL